MQYLFCTCFFIYFIFLVSHFNFLLIPCGRLSWLPLSFLLHVTYRLSYTETARIQLGVRERMSFMPTSSVRKKLDRWKMMCPSRQVILHQYAKFYPNRATLSRKKWHHVDFQDGGSQPSYRSSIDTIALNCLVFEKLAFFGVATRWQKISKICLFVLT